MISPVYARLRSITLEGFREVDSSSFVVTVLVKWVATNGAIEIDRCELVVAEPLEHEQWRSAQALLQETAQKL